MLASEHSLFLKKCRLAFCLVFCFPVWRSNDRLAFGMVVLLADWWRPYLVGWVFLFILEECSESEIRCPNAGAVLVVPGIDLVCGREVTLDLGTYGFLLSCIFLKLQSKKTFYFLLRKHKQNISKCINLIHSSQYVCEWVVICVLPIPSHSSTTLVIM